MIRLFMPFMLLGSIAFTRQLAATLVEVHDPRGLYSNGETFNLTIAEPASKDRSLEVVVAKKMPGYHNQNFFCFDAKDLNISYVLRIAHKDVNKYTNRQLEIRNTFSAFGHGFSPYKMELYDVDTGTTLSRYRDLTVVGDDLLHSAIVVDKIVERVHSLHKTEGMFTNIFDPFLMADTITSFVATPNAEAVEMKSVLKAAYRRLIKSVLLVPCHNDLNPLNIVMANGEIYFVDYETAGLHDPLYDVASLLVFSKLGEKEEEYILDSFGVKNDSERAKVSFYRAVIFLRSAIWAYWRKSVSDRRFLDAEWDRYFESSLKQCRQFWDLAENELE